MLESDAAGATPPHPPREPAPPPHRQPRWNTPAELHQLWYVLAGRAPGNKAMPALVNKGSNLKDLKQVQREGGRKVRQMKKATVCVLPPGEEGVVSPLSIGSTRSSGRSPTFAPEPARPASDYRFCSTPPVPRSPRGERAQSTPNLGTHDHLELGPRLLTEDTCDETSDLNTTASSAIIQPGPRGGMCGEHAPLRSPKSCGAMTPGSRRGRFGRGLAHGEHRDSTVQRVRSSLSAGHGVGFYAADDMTFSAAGAAPLACEVRVSNTQLIVHHRRPPNAAAPGSPESMRQGSLRPKLILKLPLIHVLSVDLDNELGVIHLEVRQPEPASGTPTSAPGGSPSAHALVSPLTSPLHAGKRETLSSMASMPSLASIPQSLARHPTLGDMNGEGARTVWCEICSEDEVALEELTHCLVHQQTKAFQAELGRLRRSLKPKGTKTLDIVHFNDVYHLNVHKKEEPCGGLTRFYHALEEIRRKKNPLVLFSGDFVGPSLMSVVTKGKQMIDALNFVGAHYGVFGNHEFDFGLRNLERIVHGYTQGEYIFCGSTTTWVMSNMDGKNGFPLGNVEPKKLLMWNGVRVGILGLCENWLPHCPRLTPDEAVYRDIFEVGEAEAQVLKEEGAEVVIALTHNRLAMDKHVTKRCPSIDLLLGGHDHFYKKDIDARVIKSGEEFQWLSEVAVHVPEEDAAAAAAGITVQCRTWPISSDLPESEIVDKLVQRYGEKMQERMGKTIGRSPVPFDSTEEACRFHEGALTNFLADLMENETGADCAVLGGAAVAGKVLQEAGLLTIGDVFNWFPDEIKVQVVEMTGHWLHHMLQKSVMECPEEAPSFPHPSASLAYTLSVIGVPSVTGVSIKEEPLDPDRLYKVAVTDFVAAGKERFSFVKDHCQVLTDSEHAEQFSMWILDYFRRRQVKAEADEQAAAKEKATKRIRRRSSFGVENVPEVEDPLQEGFELMDDDLQDLGEDTMRALMRALMLVSEETSPQTAQTSIKAAVKKLLDCDRATIFLVDPVRQQLRFLPDGADKEVRIPITAGIAGACATAGEVLSIPDAYDDPRFNQAVDKQTGYRTHNILASPVKRRDGSVVAVMQAVNKRRNQGFTTYDAKILNLFGKQTAITLGHAEVFASLKKNQDATNTLLRVARDIASDVAMDMKTMIACIMSGSSQLLQSDRSSLFLVDSEAQEMWTIIIDPNTGAETIVRLPVGTGLAGHTAVSGQLLNLYDAYDSPLFNSEFDKKSGYRTKQVLCVPIFTSEESSDVLGVLQFINKIDGTDFSKQDEATAEAFASFAGISIANTQEIDLLKLKSDEKLFLEIPPPTMGRIQLKGGWTTVRRILMDPRNRNVFKDMHNEMVQSRSFEKEALSFKIRRLMTLRDLKANEVGEAAASGSLPAPLATTRAKLQSVRVFRDSIRQRALTQVTGKRAGSPTPPPLPESPGPFRSPEAPSQTDWRFAGSPVTSEISVATSPTPCTPRALLHAATH
eukprot:TRINITY_DN7525_c0_g1_i1.p1 TRINITY_DN7525_c0_g1~~TRINITY_DN7525_c0_g1_i1.p1  ORF type:complete len:1476 (+),score=555.39 TRINITY_DN7525_c0_g1_i1:109-4536(+)